MPSISPIQVNRVNHVNIGLMFLSGILAYAYPFHCFLISYAVLGPLHYLTEISWLHDRKYFSQGRFGFIWLGLLSLLDPYSGYLGIAHWGTLQNVGGIAFFSAGAMAFIRRWPLRVAAVGACLLFPWLPLSWGPYLFLQVFLTSLVHVFLFTWMFVLYGALKSRSRTGYWSLAVLTGVAAGLLFLPPPWKHVLSVSEGGFVAELGNLHNLLAFSLGWTQEGDGPVRAMQFIAFAYTYHYLNWFSKTRIIEWHKVSRRRLAGIATLYAGLVGVYAYDFRIGLMWSFSLSLGHVLLEFPLNFKTAVGIFVEMRGRIRPVSAKPQSQELRRSPRRKDRDAA